MEDKKKILIVDDEKVVRITLSDLLTKEGYEVESVAEGNAALEKIKEEEYDIVLLDVILPDINGIEMLGEIKRGNPSTSVIIITGFGAIEDAVRAVKMGAYDYICKPFKKNEIQSLVKRALEKVKLEEKFQKRTFREDGIELFKKMTEYGSPGLCITMGGPDKLQRKCDIPEVPVVKLSTLNDVCESINNFVKNNKSAVVLLFGFEYLLKKYSAKRLIDFFYEFNNTLAINDARLIVTYDKGSVIQESFESFVHEVSDAQVHSVFNILASPLRRDLLLYLESQGKSIFTKIQQVLDVENAPNLSFHLRTLKNAGFIEENDEKRYFLSDMGKEVCDLLRRFEIAGVKKFESIIWTSTD